MTNPKKASSRNQPHQQAEQARRRNDDDDEQRQGDAANKFRGRADTSAESMIIRQMVMDAIERKDDDDDDDCSYYCEEEEEEGHVENKETNDERIRVEKQEQDETGQTHNVSRGGDGNMTREATTKDQEKGVSRVSAGSLPLPTELRRGRHAAAEPGAVVVHGPRGPTTTTPSAFVRRSISTGGDDGDDDVRRTAPLLAATLVEESTEFKTVVVAHAEPMDESSFFRQGPTSNSEDDDHQDHMPMSPVPLRKRKRRKFYLCAGILIGVCVVGGIASGVGFAVLGSDSDNDDANKDRFETIRRLYYLVQWGSVVGGCIPPPSVHIHMSCGVGGQLSLLEIPNGVTCVWESTDTNGNSSGPGMVCSAQGPSWKPVNTGSSSNNNNNNNNGATRTLLDTHNNNNQHHVRGGWYQTTIPARRRIQEGSRLDELDLTENTTIAEMQVNSAQLIAYCEGDVVGSGDALALSTSAEFGQVSAEESFNLPPRNRTGFCDFLWKRTLTPGRSNTESRLYGGAVGPYSSVGVLCPPVEGLGEEPDKNRITLEPTTCEKYGGWLVVGGLEASLPICFNGTDCQVRPTNCPVSTMSSEPDDICRRNCTVASIGTVETAPVSRRGGLPCSVDSKQADDLMKLEVIEASVEPYLITDAKDLKSALVEFLPIFF